MLATTISICPTEAENKTRPFYISSMAAPAPVVVPGMRTTTAFSDGQSSRHFEQGLAFKKSGDNNRALIEFLQAIKENPRCIKAFYEQALIFRSKGYPKLAESSLCQAIAVNPGFREARILLAAVRLEAGNTGGAAQELTRSLGLADNLKASTPPPPVVHAALAPLKLPPPISAVNSAKNALVFQGENAKDLKIESKPAQDDDWARRLKYLSVNGTGSLKAGEAFMFSEETGEAVIFLADGRRIRRIISAPQDTHELVKARRPDMLIPADLLYKLSTLGKLVGGDPSAIIDLSDAKDAPLDKSRERDDSDLTEASEAPAKKTKLAANNKESENTRGTLGELMDGDDQNADNSYSRKAIFDNGEFDKVVSPAMAKDAGKGQTLNSTEPTSLKDFNKEPVNESIVEKTQKLFSWLKKTLHI